MPLDRAEEAFHAWLRAYGGSIDLYAMRLAYAAGTRFAQHDHPEGFDMKADAGFDAWMSTYTDPISTTGLEHAFNAGRTYALKSLEVTRFAYEEGRQDALEAAVAEIESRARKGGVGDASFLNGMQQGYDNALHALRALVRDVSESS